MNLKARIGRVSALDQAVRVRRVASRPLCGTFRAIGGFRPAGRPARSARAMVA
jgi:hypothetical protein